MVPLTRKSPFIAPMTSALLAMLNEYDAGRSPQFNKKPDWNEVIIELLQLLGLFALLLMPQSLVHCPASVRDRSERHGRVCQQVLHRFPNDAKIFDLWS